MPVGDAIPVYVCFPFVIFLLLIAILPLALPHFWEKNRNKAIVSALVSLPVLPFLLTRLPAELGRTAEDYVSFILLLASLFIISGGIVLTGDLRATPRVNTAFLFLGAVICNLIGTTGASMLLIRPLLKTNSERKHAYHLPVFFIFVVANIGGSLTPLGDPPLFLGFLRGVPFTWTFNLFPMWLTALTLVLGVFYLWDTRAYRKESPADLRRDRLAVKPLRVSGRLNLLFLAGVILAVFLRVPFPYRELTMVAMSLLSLAFTKQGLRAQHGFTFAPINEVAILFAGIFLTMVPLLTLLEMKGAELGITQPWQFFWLSGGLSSFLDNAPTYLTFSSLAESVTRSQPLAGLPVIAGVRVDLLRALSCGSVFMGANTYIGNGPNFMVKVIAEEQGVAVPHFFGYMLYSGLVLIPTFLIVTVLFFL
jgi:Na+/H+ antiporter NhaD/arsenite permease-like protein